MRKNTHPDASAADKKKNRTGQRPDLWLLFATMLLLTWGIIMVFSSSQYTALNEMSSKYNSYYYLEKQLRNAGVGLVGMALAYFIPYKLHFRISSFYYVVMAGFLLLMLFSSMTLSGGGAARWFKVGDAGSFQPSEFAKLIVPIATASYCTKHLKDLELFSVGCLKPLLLVLSIAVLILAESDLSTAVVVAGAGIVVVFCAGTRIKHLLFSGGSLGVLGVVGIALKNYRMDRVLAWLDPWNPKYIGDDSWQETQSLMAIGNGGLTGVGLGNGGSKWFYLPEQHTDFIFSVLCEEMGFVFAFLMIVLIGVIIWRGVLVAVKAPDVFSSLVSIGLVSCLAIQSIINLCVCTGLCPVTGVTLPFVSYGGSSLLVSMTMMGLLLNISAHSRS